MKQELLKNIQLIDHTDGRGSLSVIEGGETVPFEIQRAFLTYAPSPGSHRGGHANRKTTFAMVNVSGQCTLRVSNGEHSETVTLDRPMQGVLLPPMIWKEIFDYSQDSVVLFLSDRHYDKDDYICDPEAFQKERNALR